MKIIDVKELGEMMTPEQKEESAKNFKKFYTDPFGESEPVMCTSHEDDDGEKYLRKVNVADFNPHTGESLDDFLEKEGLLEEVNASLGVK